MKTEGAAFLRSMYLSPDIIFFSLMQEPDRPQQHQQEAWMIPPVIYQIPDAGFSAWGKDYYYFFFLNKRDNVRWNSYEKVICPWNNAQIKPKRLADMIFSSPRKGNPTSHEAQDWRKKEWKGKQIKISNFETLFPPKLHNQSP